MPGPTAQRASRKAGDGTLAQAFRHFGEVEVAGRSPLYERVAVAVSGSGEALRALEAMPVRQRRPAVILAALHDLALAGRAPALAAAYAAGDGDAAAGAAVDTVLGLTDTVLATAARRLPRTLETTRCTVLHPAVAEAAHRAGADAVGLIGVSCSAGLDAQVDRVGITYSTGQRLGDPSSPVQLTSSLVGGRPVPARAIPEVVARVGIDAGPRDEAASGRQPLDRPPVDRHPFDPADPDDARWLRACLAPDDPDGASRLEAELEVASGTPAERLQGDVVDLLPDALARVPADALPVVTTAWALSRLSLERRLRFLHRLDDAAAGRAVAWVSLEGVGVAPTVPTFGDRRASGHSIIGVVVLDGSTVHAEAVGRCWSRGRFLSWPAGT